MRNSARSLMYVSQTSRTNQSGGTKRAKTKNRGGATFSVPSAGAEKTAASSLGAQPVGPLGALIAVQEVDTVQSERRRSVKKANEVLDILEELKLGLLSNQMSPANIRNLELAVDELAPPPGDNTLKSLIDGIVLRAKVELAKIAILSANKR